MLDYANPVLLKARRLGQRIGILRPLVRAYRRLLNKKYEDVFDTTLLNEIKSGDIVWDVGANVGFYTRKFAEKVGASGQVIAFEPAPQTLEILRSAASAYSQVTIVPAALSDYNGTVKFAVDENNKNSSISTTEKNLNTVDVKVYRGDDFNKEKLPNIIKIDVEGFELEAIARLEQTLTNEQLRAVFIEVHFVAMAERGLANGVVQLKEKLRGAGLSLRWTDPSHIVAMRVPYTYEGELGEDHY